MGPTPRVPHRGQSKAQLSVCNIRHRRFERTYRGRDRSSNRFSKCLGTIISEWHRRPQNAMDMIGHDDEDIRQYVRKMHRNSKPRLRYQRTQPIELCPAGQHLTKQIPTIACHYRHEKRIRLPIIKPRNTHSRHTHLLLVLPLEPAKKVRAHPTAQNRAPRHAVVLCLNCSCLGVISRGSSGGRCGGGRSCCGGDRPSRQSFRGRS